MSIIIRVIWPLYNNFECLEILQSQSTPIVNPSSLIHHALPNQSCHLLFDLNIFYRIKVQVDLVHGSMGMIRGWIYKEFYFHQILVIFKTLGME